MIENQTVILAKTQTNGRGRFTRVWFSEPGGLYFSIVLKPRQTAFLQNITQLMALSVCQTLQALGAPAQLKWPNDVLVSGQKICGILSEAVTVQNQFAALVVGVGINVGQRDLSRVDQPAVSLVQLNIDTDEEMILQQVLDRFFNSYELLLQEGFSAIAADYINSFAYIGKEVEIRYGTSPLRGKVKTISSDGELVLQTPAGQKIISIGEMYL